MDLPLPQRPHHLPYYSEICLQALVDQGLARHISLGGGLGLLHTWTIVRHLTSTPGGLKMRLPKTAA
jgi:hypothetical protein